MKKQVFLAKVKENEKPESIREKIARLFDAASFADCIAPKDLVAIKIHFGEKGGDGQINAQFAKVVSDKIKVLKARPFFSDTNTLYAGSRSNSHDHLLVAAEHGYSIEKIGAPVIIADGLKGRNQVDVPVEGAKHFKVVRIAPDFLMADAMAVLTHVTGHLAAGYAGAIKNVGMGCAARAGKLAQHSNILPEIIKEKCTGCGTCVKWCPEHAMAIVEKKAHVNQSLCISCGECLAVCKSGAVKYTWGNKSTMLCERMSEHACGALKDKLDKCVFMNFIIKFTHDCDCMGIKQERMIPDVGILASKDIVAIDRASVDVVNKAAGKDIFKEMYPALDHMSQVAHAEALGLGSQDYDLLEMK
jgi:hypothetical protein